MIRIKVIDPNKPDKLQELDLNLENKPNHECFIGRNLNCDLVLDDGQVSRMHGKFSHENGNCYFADLASSHGSRINGETAQMNHDYPIKIGDMIKVGRYFLMIVETSLSEKKEVIEPVLDDGITEIELPGFAKGISSQSDNQPQIRAIITPQEYMPLAFVNPSTLQRWSQGELTVRCIGVIDETHDVKTFRFVSESPMLFTYKPGQFITLNLQINGEEISRSYSISSTPSRPHTLEITVKRVPPDSGCEQQTPKGLVSNWLHDNVKVDTSIEINGPFGNFTCFANPAEKLLLISAGSGITPMMSMSRWLCDTAANCDIIFFHCARSPRDIIYRHELEMMSARYDNFHLAVSTTSKEAGHSWLSLTGRLDSVMMRVVAPDYSDRTVYVCGPDTFMQSTKQMLESISFPMQNYYEERFGTTKKSSNQQSLNNSTPVVEYGLGGILNNILKQPAQQPDVNNQAVVSQDLPKPPSKSQTAVFFSKSGKKVVCDGEEPILSLALKEKVKIPFGCRAGVCGACKTLKLQGEVSFCAEPSALDESQIKEGYILTCISYPVGEVVIDA